MRSGQQADSGQTTAVKIQIEDPMMTKLFSRSQVISISHLNVANWAMARKKKLRPGTGAIGEILTRFIKPSQPFPSKNHRTLVVLEEEGEDDNKKRIFRFHYDGDESEDKALMWANQRYVKVLQEGDHLLLFGGPGEPRAPEYKEDGIKWRFSKARRLLAEDINNREVEFDEDDDPIGMTFQEIYIMRPEYADYKQDLFEERVLAIWKKAKKDMNRADEDLAAFEEFMGHNEVALFNKHGVIIWQGSDAQEQALVDLAENNIRDFGYRHVYDSNAIYHQNFPYDLFKEYVKQEIGTKKYLHTVAVRDLQKREKRDKRENKKTKT